MDFTYNFKVQGDTLTETIKSQFGEVTLENGKVDERSFLTISALMETVYTAEKVEDPI